MNRTILDFLLIIERERNIKDYIYIISSSQASSPFSYWRRELGG
jgi:hypothetical protein